MWAWERIGGKKKDMDVGPIKDFVKQVLKIAKDSRADRLELIWANIEADSVQRTDILWTSRGGTVTRINDTTLQIDVPSLQTLELDL